jgi:glyoxylase-like metal-dependent hydrolase (beta-lactamase superfamily II)
VATTDLDAWSTQFTWPREISRPPTPFTPDWQDARASIRKVAGLEPSTIAAGHGLPIDGENLVEALRSFAESMTEPEGGRYAHQPAQYAEDGSLAVVPPPAPDPLPK